MCRTRTAAPAASILDGDATADPVHGAQTRAGSHGDFAQHPYVPLHVYEGHTGFPRAVWWRPGTGHARRGAVAILRPIVAQWRAAWPGVRLLVRADNGLGVPAVEAFCAAAGWDYVLGYARNRVRERATALALADVEWYYHFYGSRAPHVQRFAEIRAYQAGTWPHPRRGIAKVDRTPRGSQRRVVVTKRTERPAEIDHGLYRPRGAVPEQPLGEMKNGVRCDRLSSSGCCAHAFRLRVHAVAYARVVLFREAAAAVAAVATASVGTLRQRLWKVGAVVVTSARRVGLHVSQTWPYRQVWPGVPEAVAAFVSRWHGTARAPASAAPASTR